MAQPAASDKCRVTVANTGQSFDCPPDELILDAGLAAGIGLPHNCRGGACGTCKSQVVEGEVDHGWVMSFAISDEEKAAGKCLICQSKPRGGTLVIRTDNPVAGAEDTPPAPIEATARVLASEPLTPSLRRLVLALPAEVRFRYRAGMHVELKTPNVAKARTYSIANAPDREGLPPDGLLEFFVTRHEQGQASGWLHAPERLGATLSIHGPYGTFHLPKALDEPLLCLAGGSGLAPVLAILRQALGTGFSRPVRLILSVRDRSEIFALDVLHALARRHANFAYLLSLTRTAEIDAATGWRHGRVPIWLGQEFFDLSGHCVLAAGPPGFVDAMVANVKELGARPGRILTDSFTPTAG
jgi:CDP-4-dehydro-6-deoxyglucose reductase, E3